VLVRAGPVGPSGPLEHVESSARSRVATRSRMVPRSPSNWSRAPRWPSSCPSRCPADAGMPGRHACHVPEAPAARRAAKRRSGPGCGAFMRVAATRWGTCETTATMRSWSAGERRPRRRRARPRRRSSGCRRWVGRGGRVSTQVAPTKSRPRRRRSRSARSRHRVATDETWVAEGCGDRCLHPPTSLTTTSAGRRRSASTACRSRRRSHGCREEDHLGCETFADLVERTAARAAVARPASASRPLTCQPRWRRASPRNHRSARCPHQCAGAARTGHVGGSLPCAVGAPGSAGRSSRSPWAP